MRATMEIGISFTGANSWAKAGAAPEPITIAPVKSLGEPVAGPVLASAGSGLVVNIRAGIMLKGWKI